MFGSDSLGTVASWCRNELVILLSCRRRVRRSEGLQQNTGRVGTGPGASGWILRGTSTELQSEPSLS
jgi:hypothetical protein